MGKAGGVEIREKSIRLHFTFEGKPCRETIKTDGAPLPPTPANIKYAHRLAAEIKDKIRHGTFNYFDYFPASQRATTGQGATVADQLDAWLKVQSTLADSTVKAYRVAVEFWKIEIGAKTLKALKHSDVLAALAKRPEWTGKTRNNKVSVLRQALVLAIRDGVIASSPLDGLEASPHQTEPADPFSLEEVELILAHMRNKYGGSVADYFEFKFFTGLRTGESLAVQWGNIDFNRRQMSVTQAITLGIHKANTKTNTTRVVELNSRAMAVLERQKALTLLHPGGWVFHAPTTGDRWQDDSGPRKTYWYPTLKKLGIRHRGPYNTRHTYATVMLMSGVTPAYAARQLGHSVDMFLRIYAKWLDGGQNALEMGKVEALILPQKFPRNRESS